MNLGGAYSSLFAGVLSTASAVLLSTASSILGELHLALRGLAVCLLLVDLSRDARAVHPAGRTNRTTSDRVQLGHDIIDTAARGSSSCLVVRYILGDELHVCTCRTVCLTRLRLTWGRGDIPPKGPRTPLQTMENYRGIKSATCNWPAIAPRCRCVVPGAESQRERERPSAHTHTKGK